MKKKRISKLVLTEYLVKNIGALLFALAVSTEERGGADPMKEGSEGNQTKKRQRSASLPFGYGGEKDMNLILFYTVSVEY